jgi:Ni/Co efflux regulator RcnB
MMRFVLLFALAVGTAAAQPAKKQPQDNRDRQMSREERQRMREDVRDAYRHRDRQERPQRSQQMTAEERVKLRRDIEDANKNLKR